MKKIIILITALMIGLSFGYTSVPHTSIHTKKEKKEKMYRTSPRENGKYYAIESSYDGGKTWHSTGDSSPDLEEANKKMAAAEKAGAGNGDWAYQKGPSDEIVEKYTGKVDPTKEEVKDAVNEIIEKAVTDKQQGIQSIGNQGDNNEKVLLKEYHIRDNELYFFVENNENFKTTEELVEDSVKVIVIDGNKYMLIGDKVIEVK